MKRFAFFILSLFIAVPIGLSISNAAQYDPEVYQAQKALKVRGYNPGIPDGLFGIATQKAINRFQSNSGLPVTGKLDERTKAKLGLVSSNRSVKRKSQTGEQRVALVIGNSAYKSSPLINPVNDAQDMATALRDLGFEVMHKENASQREMEESIRSFGTKLRKGGVGLFYYAGHGIQIGGRNYLIPTDSEVYKEIDVKYESVDAGRVLDEMYDAGNGLNIVLLDACRDNPFARSFRTSRRGLAKMDAPTGTFIAYSTGPDSTAADGTGRNGVFTEYLLKHMILPGLKIEDVMKRVRNAVIRETNNKQVPWQASSLTGDFYFNIKGDTSYVTYPAPVSSAEDQPMVLPKNNSEVSFDDMIKASEVRRKASARWDNWQQARNNEYSQIKKIDNDIYITPSQKVEAWKRFLAAVSQDNPFGTEDNEMRLYARSRVSHWEEEGFQKEKLETLIEKDLTKHNKVDMSLYRAAKSEFDKGNFDGARQEFHYFLEKYPKSGNADNAQFWIGETYYREKWYEKAILEYQKVIETYPKGNMVPASLLKQGLAFFNLRDKANGRLILRELVSKYPRSNEAKIAKQKLKEIK